VTTPRNALTAVACCCLGLGAVAGARAASNVAPGGIPSVAPKVSCTISIGSYYYRFGYPQKIPDSVVIKNAGVVPIPSGTLIRWNVAPGPGKQAQRGDLVLPQALAPNATHAVSLGGDRAGPSCTAQVLVRTGR
jgi:hypothetical protein